MIKKITSKKVILVTTLAILVILGVIFILLTPQKPALPSLTTLLPSPAPTLAFPTIIPAVDRPRLTIVWDVAAPSFPGELPFYQNTSPLLTQNYIQDLAARLGFSQSDFQADPASTKNLLYLKGSKSLSANTDVHQLTYSDTTIPKTGDFDNPKVFTQNALQKIKSILAQPSLEIITTSDVTYLQNIPPYLGPATQTNAQFGKMTFTQSVSSYPYVTASANNVLITAVYDQNYNLHFLEMLGGFTNLKTLGTKTTIDFTTLQKIAPADSQIISSTNNIEKDNTIAASSTLDLTVSQVQVAYFNLPGTDLLQPVFLLTGKIIGKNVPSTPAVYMVPAYPSSSYLPSNP